MGHNFKAVSACVWGKNTEQVFNLNAEVNFN